MTITEINSRGDILITTKSRQYKGYRREKIVKGRPVTSENETYLVYPLGTPCCLVWKTPDEIKTLP